MCVIFGFCMLIDALSDRSAPSSFMPPLLVALPAIFIMPLSATYAITAAFAIAYCTIAGIAKEPFVAQHDIFQAIVAFAFSICVAYLVMGYRVGTNETRMRFQELSMRDALADIFNRRALTEAAEALLAASNPLSSCSVAIIDIDDFKIINDTHGHLSGDGVIREMGSLLKEHFGPDDLIGRFGGDEFIVFAGTAITEPVLQAKLTSVQHRFAQAGKRLVKREISCSIGAVVAFDDMVEFTDLLAQADAALYESKQHGKNRLTIKRHQHSDATS